MQRSERRSHLRTLILSLPTAVPMDCVHRSPVIVMPACRLSMAGYGWLNRGVESLLNLLAVWLLAKPWVLLASIPGAVIELSPAPAGGNVDDVTWADALQLPAGLPVDLNWPAC